jgi:AAA ATPase domain
VDAALTELARSTAGPFAGVGLLSIERHTVGRQPELAELRAGFLSVVAGHGLMLCVAGEPGIGKTTLVKEFLEELAARGTGRTASPAGAARSAWPAPKLAYVGSKCAAMRLLVVLSYRPSDLLLNQHPFLRVKMELQGRGVCRDILLGFLRS